MAQKKNRIGVFVASVVAGTVLFLLPKFETDEEALRRQLGETEDEIERLTSRLSPDIRLSINEAKTILDRRSFLLDEKEKIQRKLGI